MSIIQRLTPWSTPFETVNRFSATFNAEGTGKYNFGFDATQQGQTVLALRDNYVYLIDRVSFSCTTPEGTYLEAIEQMPGFRLKFLHGDLVAFPNAIPGVKYHDAMEFSWWFYADKRSDQLIVDMEGILDQVAGLVGVEVLYAQLSLVIYQENNSQIVSAIRGKTAPGAGAKFYTDVS